MIDFKDIEPAISITTKYILSKLSEEQIFFYYFGPFSLNKAYPSKFGKDSRPSTGFYINRYGHIIYNDFRTSEKLNCFEFVAKLHNLRFNEALQLICNDFGLVKSKNIKPLAQHIIEEGVSFDRELKKETIIQVIPKQWQPSQLKYWEQYEIGLDELRKEDIYPVGSLFINKMEWKNLDNLCFAYAVKEKVGKEVKTYLKIYQPYSVDRKWISNVPLTVPFGLYNLRYGSDHIIITKAMKDMLVLRKLFTSVIGTQNESRSALHQYTAHLKWNFNRRTIIWDADDTGVENCKKFNDEGFGYFNTPRELLEKDIKDVSDYVKAYGLKALEKLLKTKNIL